MQTVAIICGGPSAEHEVSLSSGEVACQRIRRRDRQVRPIFITRDGRWALSNLALPPGEGPLDPGLQAALNELFKMARVGFPNQQTLDTGEALVAMKSMGVNVALLALHGAFGEDGRVQGLLEMARIPYTGSGVLASAVAMDKPSALAAFKRAGIPTPVGTTVRKSDFEKAGGQRNVLEDVMTGPPSLKFPLFVKPAEGGSSVGTGPAHNADQLVGQLKKVFALSPVALVEEAVSGREISVGVIEAEPGKPVALPPTEIVLHDSEFFDYEAKYTPGKCQEVTPAQISPAQLAAVRHAAITAHTILGCYGYSRTDLILPVDGRHPAVILETNTLPGLTPNSILPQQAAAMNITFEELIDLLIAQALVRGTPLDTMGMDSRTSRF